MEEPDEKAIKEATNAVLTGHPGLQPWEPAILTRAVVNAYHKALEEEGD